MVREAGARITCTVTHELLSHAVEAMDGISVPELNIQGGRIILARPARGPRFLLPSTSTLMELRADVLTLTVPRAAMDWVGGTLVDALDLTQPGRGSLYMEEVEVYRGATAPALHTKPVRGKVRRWLKSLVGVTCIAQRELGNTIASIALDAGTSVPVVTYGQGTGLRNKLGLLRLAVPAEKEVVTMVTTDVDVHSFMELLVEEARLDQPGRGFVFVFPIKAGQVDTRIFLGTERHAASIEQIVTAIDDMSRSTRWRRRFPAELSKAATDRWSARDRLVSLTLGCAEGQADTLVRAAMRAGAGGATTRRTTLRGPEPGAAGPARERSEIVVPANRLDDVVAAVEEAGAFQPEKEGVIEASSCEAAYTYRHR